MREIDIKKLREETFPEQVVKAYGEMVKAQEKFNRFCKTFSPEVPLEEGDRVIIDDVGYGIVKSVTYKPYGHSHNTIGSWYIIVAMKNKEFKDDDIKLNYVILNDKMNIKIVEDGKI